MIQRTHEHRPVNGPGARSAIGIAGLLLVGGLLTGCEGTAADATQTFHNPVTIGKTADSAIARLSVTAHGAERLGLATAPVRADPKGGLLLPYAALLYMADGTTWVYTSPAELVYVRHAVEVRRVDGQWVSLSAGPATGTRVVVTGAAELFGAEFDTGE
jgi:multidrug efflux pump subunit AcrA (membrane-fusion protein)